MKSCMYSNFFRSNPRLSPLERAREKTSRARNPVVGHDMSEAQWMRFGAKWRADYAKALSASYGRPGSEDYHRGMDIKSATETASLAWSRMKGKSRESFVRAVGGSEELDAATSDKLQHDLDWDALGWDPDAWKEDANWSFPDRSGD